MDFNHRLADELDALPEDSKAIDQAISNYIVLRDKIRACEEKSGTLGES
jgi:hypothetical protein